MLYLKKKSPELKVVWGWGWELVPGEKNPNWWQKENTRVPFARSTGRQRGSRLAWYHSPPPSPATLLPQPLDDNKKMVRVYIATAGRLRQRTASSYLLTSSLAFITPQSDNITHHLVHSLGPAWLLPSLALRNPPSSAYPCIQRRPKIKKILAAADQKGWPKRKFTREECLSRRLLWKDAEVPRNLRHRYIYICHLNKRQITICPHTTYHTLRT